MMMMAEEPERRRLSVPPISTMIAVSSPDEDSQSQTTTKDAAISSISSIDTEPPDENHSKEEESDDFPTEIMTRTRARARRTKRYEQSMDIGGEAEESDEVVNNYSINPNSLSTPSPSSPAGSLKSNGGGSGCGGANSATRRIFTPEFKQRVLEAFTNDPECIGNQRATARKFNIHRRQVQKWLQQLSDSDSFKDQQSSDEQEQKINKKDKEAEISTQNSSPVSFETRNSLTEKIIYNNNSPNIPSVRSNSSMPIVAGKVPSLTQTVSSSPSVTLPTSSPLINIGKSIGNIQHHQLFSNTSSNMLMGITSPLLSANLSLPLSLDSTRLSPHLNCINGSPPNGNISSAQKMLQLVDELCYLYPSEDFSLLRRAMIKNEVSFTKISPPPLRRHTSSNSYNTSLSPSPSKSSSTNDYITQQTLQMIKNQNEYLQLLHSGYTNFSNYTPETGNLADSTNKYSSWLNPFAAAAAVGFNVPGLGKNGNGLENNRRRNNDSSTTSSSSIKHTFASPKAPMSNSKSKTVAAVLAACRNSPTNTRSTSGSSIDKSKRSSQRRKANNGRPMKSSTITRSPNDDDFIDPTSMLEVVTTKPSGSENHYSFMSDNEGMDLSTTAASVIQKSPNMITTTSTLRSKAMNKDYGFLNELGLVRKENSEINGHINPSLISSTASLEHFVQNVLPQQKLSPPNNSFSPAVMDANSSSTESSDRSKNLVLEAFNYDPELAGDARGVARKYGLNIRVVQKWIREAPTRSIPSSSFPVNGTAHLITDTPLATMLSHTENNPMEDNNHLSSSYIQKSRILQFASTNGPTVNKRKNPKPNQICDFTDDLESNGPLDMVVPIKKRRVSTPTPTSA